VKALGKSSIRGKKVQVRRDATPSSPYAWKRPTRS